MFGGFARSSGPNLPVGAHSTPQPRVARVISPGTPTLTRVISPEPLYGPVPVPIADEDSPTKRNLNRQAPPMLSELDLPTPPLGRQYSGLSAFSPLHAPSPLHRTISTPHSSTTSPKSFPVSSYALSEAPVRPPGKQVGFVGSPTHSVHRSEISVQPYSEVYGIHPRSFNFDRFGDKVPSDRPTPIGPDDLEYAPVYSGQSLPLNTPYSPQARQPASGGYPAGSRPAAAVVRGGGYGAYSNGSYGGSQHYRYQAEPSEEALFGGGPPVYR